MLTLQRFKEHISEDVELPKKHRSGVFVTAFLFYILINVLFYFADACFLISAKTQNERYFDFLGLRKICLQVKNNSVNNRALLLGSSLFVYPLRMLDKKLGEKIGLHCTNFNQYHTAADLDNKLKLAKLSCVGVRTLAVGGAMISDNFLLLNKFIDNKNQFPHWIFVDCDPRAFYDSGMIDARVTPLFNCLFDLKDYFFLGDYFLPSYISKIEFLVKYFCPLYAHGKWLSASLNEYLSQTSHFYQARVVRAKVLTNQNINGSLQEYRQHYAGISREAIETQLHFLKLLAHMCKVHGGKLVLLDMPLTEQNKDLLPHAFDTAFKNSIESIAQNEDSIFVDLNDGKYCQNDFDDSVHLNCRGGEKLENEIIKLIKDMSSNSQFSKQP